VAKKPYDERTDPEKYQWHTLKGLHSHENGSAAIVRTVTAVPRQ
jgi:hypothetical protein